MSKLRHMLGKSKVAEKAMEWRNEKKLEKAREDPEAFSSSSMTEEEAEKILCGIYTPPYQDLNVIRMKKPEKPVDISIIIPMYNAQDTIAECIESCLDQVIDPMPFSFEVIAVDDGSTDRTAEIAESYDKVHVIRKKNGGQSSARNEGLRAARGNYICFMDSDDRFYSNDSLEKLFYGKRNADIVCGGIYQEAKNRYITCREYRDNARSDAAYEARCAASPGYPVAKLYKRELFDRICFPEGYWFEDSIVHLILFERAKSFATIKDTVYYYRDNPNGVTAGKDVSPKCLDHLYVFDCIMLMRFGAGLDFTPGFLIQAMYHFSISEIGRMKCLSREAKEAAFISSCRRIKNILERTKEVKMTEDQELLKAAFTKKEYGLWSILSKAEKR